MTNENKSRKGLVKTIWDSFWHLPGKALDVSAGMAAAVVGFQLLPLYFAGLVFDHYVLDFFPWKLEQEANELPNDYEYFLGRGKPHVLENSEFCPVGHPDFLFDAGETEISIGINELLDLNKDPSNRMSFTNSTIQMYDLMLDIAKKNGSEGSSLEEFANNLWVMYRGERQNLFDDNPTRIHVPVMHIIKQNHELGSYLDAIEANLNPDNPNQYSVEAKREILHNLSELNKYDQFIVRLFPDMKGILEEQHWQNMTDQEIIHRGREILSETEYVTKNSQLYLCATEEEKSDFGIAQLISQNQDKIQTAATIGLPLLAMTPIGRWAMFGLNQKRIFEPYLVHYSTQVKNVVNNAKKKLNSFFNGPINPPYSLNPITV
ncbi:hypothetical protein HN789_01250 [archaeon]|nr:hypothetical protein [archaeon]MBT4022157.1 hypothetical protein [archaeon]MBT4272770.1 hypothetical protein [archaeon]MBT4461569.1 hypothetical protein [archaeon]MBT4857663.1 hypothetical protein [archaeon]